MHKEGEGSCAQLAGGGWVCVTAAGRGCARRFVLGLMLEPWWSV